jgi:hypothetical protein
VYKTLRTLHLLCGTLSLPFLVMYGISAVQMAHSTWFAMRPAVQERQVTVPAGLDARALARHLMNAENLLGQLGEVSGTPAGLTLRIAVPGTVHEVSYDRAANSARIRTSVAGTLGMMNRLHHAAGLYPEHLPLKIWGAAVGLVSAALIGLGATGLWMWWLRRQDRAVGLVLLVANLLFSVALLIAMRAPGL